MELGCDYGGLQLKNPLIVASAGTAENTELIKKAERHGAAAVVMKTLFEEEYTRRNPSPCFKIIKRKAGPQVSTTLYSFEQASPWGLERYASEIEQTRRVANIPLIASINCINEESWGRYARILEQAGASGIEINRSCPYSTLMLSGGDMWTGLAVETVKRVKNVVSIPVFAKLTPQLSNPVGTAHELASAGADGIVMFSRFTGLEIDLVAEKPVMHGGLAGHGGLWSFHYALRWIAAAFPVVSVPLSASGGVGSGEDVIKFILAGASNVQICTAIYTGGYAVLGEYLDKIRSYMKDKGYRHLEDFRAKIISQIVPVSEVERTRSCVAVIDKELCNKCGICQKICLHGAVTDETSGFHIKETCAGCGLCVYLCQCRAISLKQNAGQQATHSV